MDDIRGILFDLDQTLVDRLSAVRRVAGLLWDEQAAVRAVDGRDAAIEKFLEFDGDGYTFPRSRVYEMACERWPGITMSATELHDWYRLNNPPGFQPDVQVHGLLTRIASAGIPIGIVTNGNTSQMMKIERAGLNKFTDAIVISETFGEEKPSPAIFEHALELIGGPPASDVLFVGDNPVNDIDGARRVGMQTAWIHRDREWPADLSPPAHVIGHVADLASLIARL